MMMIITNGVIIVLLFKQSVVGSSRFNSWTPAALLLLNIND